MRTPIVIGLTVCLGLGTFTVAKRRSQLKAIAAQRAEAERQAQISMQLRVQAEKVLNEMLQQGQAILAELSSVISSERRMAGVADTDVIFGPKDGRLTMVGLARAELTTRREQLIKDLAQKVDSIKRVAKDNGVPDSEYLDAIRPLENALGAGNYQATSQSGESHINYPSPTPTDIAILKEYAEKYQSEVNEATRVINTGNARSDEILNNLAAARVEPTRRLFNVTAEKFKANYGKEHLYSTASRFGFLTLVRNEEASGALR